MIVYRCNLFNKRASTFDDDDGGGGGGGDGDSNDTPSVDFRD